MKNSDTKARRQLVDKLKVLEEDIIDGITTQYFQRFPDENAETAKVHCAIDAGHHLSFLRIAIEYGNEEMFKQYLRWTTNLLQSRNILNHSLPLFLDHIAVTLDSYLSDSEKLLVHPFFRYSPSEVDSPEEPQTGTASPAPLALHQKVFLQALLTGDRHAARTVAFEAVSSGHQLSDVYVEMFQESLYEIGYLWESNYISVGQEHVATAITQYVMSNLYRCESSGHPFQGKGLITGVEGELHQIGSHMVADLLETRGWDIRFLGVNVPHRAILEMIKDFQPTLIGISAAMVLNIPIVQNLITEIRNQFTNETTPRILVGGLAFRSLPHVYREIGADGFAHDLRSLGSIV